METGRSAEVVEDEAEDEETEEEKEGDEEETNNRRFVPKIAALPNKPVVPRLSIFSQHDLFLDL